MFFNFVRFIANIYLSIMYRIKVIGKNNVPSNGRYIVCANHTHLVDPVVIACKIKRPIYFLAKLELFKSKVVSSILKKLNAIPVDRGKGDVSAIKSSLKVLKNEKLLGIFPEGTRVRKGEQKSAEAGLALLAIKGKAPIIPIGISGEFRFNNKIFMNIGKPIELNEYYGKKITNQELQDASEKIMKKIRSLILESE